MTLLLALVLSILGSVLCAGALAIGWVALSTIGDIREARRKRANEQAVRDAIGRIR